MLAKGDVVIIVLDTLREDYSAPLSKLLEMGFTKFRNTISQYPWTLPAHMSMLTGQLASAHHVHESKHLYISPELYQLSRWRLGNSEPNLLTKLKSWGYTNYCMSANPWLSPILGFKYDQYSGFDDFGVTGGVRELLTKRNALKNAFILLRKGALLTLVRLSWRRIRVSFPPLAMARYMDKGSAHIIRNLRHQLPHFRRPFFLLLNLMEAHEPYLWGETEEDLLPLCMLGRPPDKGWWKVAYQVHADLAASNCIKLVEELLPFDPLIIVTSDHGQLLGEKARYGHGFFLDDELLRVPLYVRFPSSMSEPARAEGFVSLTEVPHLIQSVVEGLPVQLGSDLAFSESYGCHSPLSRALSAQDKERIANLSGRRIKVFSAGGSVTYNQTTRCVEDSTPTLSEAEIQLLVKSIPEEAPPPAPGITFNPEDEKSLRERLHNLGYE